MEIQCFKCFVAEKGEEQEKQPPHNILLALNHLLLKSCICTLFRVSCGGRLQLFKIKWCLKLIQLTRERILIDELHFSAFLKELTPSPVTSTLDMFCSHTDQSLLGNLLWHQRGQKWKLQGQGEGAWGIQGLVPSDVLQLINSTDKGKEHKARSRSWPCYSGCGGLKMQHSRSSKSILLNSVAAFFHLCFLFLQCFITRMIQME